MINKRKLSVLLLFSIILISSISAISAADSNVTDVQTVDSKEIELEQSDSNQNEIQESDSSDEKISAGNPKSFSELNRTINNNTDSLIVLDDDYSYNEDTDSAFLMGIIIGRAVTIDGNGHTIDGYNNSAKGFETYNFGVLFKNISFVNLGKLVNDYNYKGGAISTNNAATKAQNCEFIGCQGFGGGAVYRATVENCTFKNCKAFNSNTYGELRYIHSALFPTVILKTMGKACPVMEHYLEVPLLTALLKIMRQVPEALSMREMLIIVHSLEI